ncbi:POTRA domain-containing protein [Hydrotalea sp.]|uniref:POTRA domain-containing protein n=1 Tax=Hydrotalea sp. TaxID=2881279 RepID=UPI00261ECAEB|nr:POTRA domain-containing protein [Hydrotalea sp.]
MRYLCLVIFLVYCNYTQAQVINTAGIQQPVEYIVGGISIFGNKKTKDYIILREATLKKGDRLTPEQLQQKLIESRELIYNTGLFVDDSVYVDRLQGNIAFVHIRVKERLYFLPLPYFRLVDRNFNEWWVQQNRSLSRVNYGIKFNYNNFTGQNDNLNIWLINGYNQQVALRYNLPFFDKKLKQGINIGFAYSNQREVNYTTSLTNQQLFFKNDNNYARTFYRFDATYSYRPNQYQRHYFRVSYNNDAIADTVAALNPQFFPNGLKQVKYIDFSYIYQYFKTDYNVYPTDGWQAQGSLYKRGVDKTTNLWQVGLYSLFAKPILPKTFLVANASATIKFPYNPYFFSQALLGYGSYQMSGLEYYVADGMAGGLAHLSLNHQLFSYILKNPIKSKTHDKIPFRFYAKIYTDVGYAYNPYINNNLLNNKLLRTWGFGLDIVSIYDFVFRFEYSFNQLGGKGLYLHANNGF